MYQGRSNRADTEDAHGDEIQNDGEDDQSDELQAKAAFQHIFQLDFAGAISNGVGGRSGRQHESKVAGQHAGDHHGKGTDSDSLAHTGQDRDKGGHDHGVGSQFSENSGDNTNQNYNQDGVHARQAGEHIGDPLRATGIPEGVAHDHGAAQQNNGVPGDVIEAGLPVADVLTFLIIHRCNHNQDCTEHGDSFIRGIGEPVTPDQRTGDPQDDTQNEDGGNPLLALVHGPQFLILPAGDGDVSRGHLVDLEELHHIEPEEGDQDDGERQADLHPVQKVDVDANGLTDQADAGGVGGGADDSCHAADGGGVGDGQDHGFL